MLYSVDDYMVQSATLCLKHAYPPSRAAKVVCVDMHHVLESVRSKDIEVGTLVNVIGYVGKWESRDVLVQAVAVWDAGNVDLKAYTRAVMERKNTG